MVRLVDDGVGQGVVVEARRGMAHAELRFVNVLRGCGIDGPVEAEDVACAVGCRRSVSGAVASTEGSAVIAGEEDKQRDGSRGGAQDGPIGGAGVLKAGVDDIFRLMRFVGLRDEAAAAGERILDGGRELGKRVHGKMADEVGSGVAVDHRPGRTCREALRPESCGANMWAATKKKQ